MDYLTMVKAVRLLSGLQGNGPSSVTNAIGIDAVIVQMVADAFRDVQNLREDFTWLRKRRSFFTQIGQEVYTLMDIFSSTQYDLKDYKQGSFIINDGTDNTYLKELDEDTYELSFLNSADQGIPSHFSIDTSNESLSFMDIPDGVYTISFQYYKEPETLITDGQVPLMPTSYHDLIVYKALEKLSIYNNTPEIFAGYSMETAKMEGRLMRGTIKPKRIQTRPMA